MTTIMVVVVLTAVLLVVQVGLTYHVRQVVAGAVQDGAATAAAADRSVGDGVGTVETLVHGSAGKLVRSLSVDASESRDVVTISASASVVSVLPGFDLSVNATSSASRERFRSQGDG